MDDIFFRELSAGCGHQHVADCALTAGFVCKSFLPNGPPALATVPIKVPDAPGLRFGINLIAFLPGARLSGLVAEFGTPI